MEKIIKAVSQKYGLDPDLVWSIVKTESSANTWAVRFEPNYKWLWYPRETAEKYQITYDTMVILQKCSFGPMQVMGALAYELGFDGLPHMLCQPEIGIEFGCKNLKRLFTKYDNESDVIAAYNAGSPRKTAGGMYQNQQYIDKVYSNLLKLRKLS